MKRLHTPLVNARYWTAITLASVFGTNLGDFYAHHAQLGIVKGLIVLAVLTALVFVIERFVDVGSETYYWLVIVLIRTGATNIADFLMYIVKVPAPALILCLAALITICGWGTHRMISKETGSSQGLPSTNLPYWLAMLGAGIFGTVAGDLCEDRVGEGAAAIILSLILLVVLFALRRRAARVVAIYWIIVAIARTTGTAIGDWFAENKFLSVGLSLCTLLSGVCFVAVLVLWRRRSQTILTEGRTPLR